tara:strand:+ start:4914 stop:5612 length:699 start_codon:yes stop_codon:yes gene_type:complete
VKNNFKQYTVKEDKFVNFSANFLYQTLKNLNNKKGGKSVAFSGGATPIPILNKLKNYNLNWQNFNFFMVDERNVPISDSNSNFGTIEKVFFKNINANSYSIINDKYSLDECIVNYEKLLFSKIDLNNRKIPVFDLILLGIGDDGHTASLFPNTNGLFEKNKVLIKNKVPQLNTERITLTYPVILNASKIIILAKGSAKDEILKDIKIGKGNHLPISRVINSKVDTTCILGIN